MWENPIGTVFLGGRVCVCPKEQLKPKDQPCCRWYQSLGDSSSSPLHGWLFCLLQLCQVYCLTSSCFRALCEQPLEGNITSKQFQSHSPHRIQSDQGGVGGGIPLQFLLCFWSQCIVCRVTNKKALFRVVKIETPELWVRSLGSWTKFGSTPPLDKVIADNQLTSENLVPATMLPRITKMAAK